MATEKLSSDVKRSSLLPTILDGESLQPKKLAVSKRKSVSKPALRRAVLGAKTSRLDHANKAHAAKQEDEEKVWNHPAHLTARVLIV